MGVLKLCFLESGLTKSLTVSNFRNKVGMTIFFFQNLPNLMFFFPEMQQENPKKFLIFEIIAFDSGSINSWILEEDSSHWQSICYQAIIIFNVSLGELYSKPGFLRVMKNTIKVLSWKFYKSLRPFNMLTVKGCSETVFVREWPNQVIERL